MRESTADGKDLAILKMLKRGRYVSGQALSKHVKVSRTAIWKRVASLRKYGYKIEPKEGSGYRLLAPTDLLLPWEVAHGLRTKFVGKVIHHFNVLDSTQDLAIRLAENNAAEGTVVVAERQTRGRGRLGRIWAAPSGGIWMSVILRPKIPSAEITLIPLLSALAVCNAITKVCKIDARVKWPNDVLINGKKVCGILAEMSCEADMVNYVVIGMGINANVDVKRLENTVRKSEGYYGLTSLMNETGKVDRVKVVKNILVELEQLYRSLQEGSDGIIQKWKERSVTLGNTVTVAQNDLCFEGKAVDVDHDGALLVELVDGSVKRIVAGDVYVRMIKSS